MKDFSHLISGVIPDRIIRQFLELELIKNGDLSRVQPSSLDILPDLNRIYEVDYFYLPRPNESVESIISNLRKNKQAREISNPVLIKGKRYLIKLKEQLVAPPVYCRMNMKSSPGRTFLHSRLVTDGYSVYDESYPRNQGFSSWLFVTPKCFSTELPDGEPISQLRFFKGSSFLSKKDLLREIGKTRFINDPNAPTLFDIPIIKVLGDEIGATPLTVDLEGDGDDIVAYKSKKHPPIIKLSSRDLNFRDYFDPISREELNGNGLHIEQDYGYLLGSYEMIKLPVEIASEVVPISEKYGEIRTHFAGYIDPGFGLKSQNGNSITLEVMSYEPGVYVRHKQPVAELKYEYMSSAPDKAYDGNYTIQSKGPKLPKYFKS
jgi:dCTP deaminase